MSSAALEPVVELYHCELISYSLSVITRLMADLLDAAFGSKAPAYDIVKGLDWSNVRLPSFIFTAWSKLTSHF